MKRYSLCAVAAVLLIALVWAGCSTTDRGPVAPNTIGVASKPAAGVIAAQNRHTDRLLAIRGVVGTAVGHAADGSWAIQVFTEAAGVAGIPRDLEGISVDVVVTGKIVALAPKGGSSPDPRSRFDRPVPIGVSTGNENECAAGTIGCRVKDASGNPFALSNNHVYARQNSASLDDGDGNGEEVLQPGRYDTGCSFDPNNIIGSLSDFELIKFDGSDNTIDAAIAASSTANLGNTTPSNGYGTPSSTATTAFVGQLVQKYGRTTKLTKGKVTGINATVNVGYSSGTAHFVGQIVVQGTKPFIKAGDSGSLLVTDPGKNPVGLLFAGTSSGIAIANPIEPVLTRFGVTVDGQ
ncbi:MAG: hypothetical protein A3F84_10290 [Candidatus Handelsmanbacteria bacterium RIFCSPLOWO2_12_FULL_64_10]|uniref:Peptidase S1 domain-containing protein n=1 Tax=Handelsmanbacteria sp. (strain RIFCSPLOWO2_12_FULL_64_10) TaxID=1817868 RepID=A0A1F6D5D6_HANXR|nr:MAG: hypothetical protein A3F84_10290 [Candidatus Handelsmanbacteria bacterium RIFCSPLOWO2_12_FULL_64_10]